MSLYQPKPGQPLTSCEKAVYKLIVEFGYSDKEIANQICKTVKTVKFHKRNIFIKKCVSSSLKLAVLHYQKMEKAA